MEFIFRIANDNGLHVDFHLDLHFAFSIWDGSMIRVALEMVSAGQMGDQRKTVNGEKRTLTIGHGIRLSLLSDEELQHLQESIAQAQIRAPVYLVALPPCDVFTEGRNLGGAYDKDRATLNVVKLTREHGIEIAMAVGNVQNRFAPQGNADPLGLCPIGVMLYQTAEEVDALILLVSPGSQC
jgi:hypothetical protein